MLSSPLSVLVFEKQKLRHLLQESPRSAKGVRSARSIERLLLTLAGQTLSYRLTAKSMATSHKQTNSDCCHEIATIAGQVGNASRFPQIVGTRCFGVLDNLH
jgi:hypothetical protein